MSSNLSQAVMLERKMTQADFDAFAALSGDANPIHVDADFAASTPFGKPVAHGAFLCSILRGLVAELVPNARQISQAVMFPNPARIGETLVFSAVVERQGEQGRVIAIQAHRKNDQAVCLQGETEMAS